MLRKGFVETEEKDIKFHSPEIVVEVGATSNILDAYHLRSWSGFDKKTDTYSALNIERDRADLSDINYQLLKGKVKGGAVQADAAHIPFENASVDKVVLNDVLNSFRVPINDPELEELFVNDGIHTTFRNYHDMVVAMQQIFNDCKRVIKDNGEIIIIRDTPDASDGVASDFLERLKTTGLYEIKTETKVNKEPDGNSTDSEVTTIKIKPNKEKPS